MPFTEVIRTLTQHTDLGYTIVADVLLYCAEFKVYKISYPYDGLTFYNRKDNPFGDNTADLAEAQVFLAGSVKWDGCSNWNFEAQESCMLHFCEREELINVGKVMALCYDIASEQIPSFCG